MVMAFAFYFAVTLRKAVEIPLDAPKTNLGSDLLFVLASVIAVDEYLMWAISEGGEEFGTDMPAFKETVSEDEIWKIEHT
tara:strand:- start:2633 stop:2872 length:240 start_codon:yes stop_codon:yes gene_type:complete